MATSTADNFNASVGQLRGRSNANDQFNKAMSDRMAMLKFDAPSALVAKNNQIQAKLGITQGSLKGVQDTKDMMVKGKQAYGRIKSAGEKMVSKVGELGDSIGQASGHVPQQGVSALSKDKLTPAETNTTTTTKTTFDPQSDQGSVTNPSGDAGKQAEFGQNDKVSASQGGVSQDADAVRSLDPTATTMTSLDPNALPGAGGKGPMGGDGKTDAPSGQDGGDGKTNAPQGQDGGDGNTNAPMPDQAPKDSLPDIPGQTLADTPPRGGSLYADPMGVGNTGEAGGMRGDSILARVGQGGGRSRAVAGASNDLAGATRSNAMNVTSMTSGDQSANATLGNLTSGLKTQANNTAGTIARGANAESSTNIHSSVSQALEDFKGQIGGALSDVQEQVKGVASQVGQVGKGVSAVGDDVANVGSKAVEGLSAGLETAGAVADALGPIGDVIGLGMAIFGGIEGSKEHTEEKDANTQAQKTLAQPVQSASQQSTSVSLDTSKMAQASVASHY